MSRWADMDEEEDDLPMAGGNKSRLNWADADDDDAPATGRAPSGRTLLLKEGDVKTYLEYAQKGTEMFKIITKVKESMTKKRTNQYMEASAAAPTTGVRDALAASGAGGGDTGGAKAYVPPSMRRDAGRDDQQGHDLTLRVQNLSEEVREGDLQQLFTPFGALRRVFLAKHREGEKEGLSKGFAFITYRDKGSCEKAIEALHGHGYDSLILSVSWAKPREN